MKCLVTLLVASYWVTCRADEDYNEEFGHRQFEMADDYLNEKRKERPDLDFELIAVIDA